MGKRFGAAQLLSSPRRQADDRSPETGDGSPTSGLVDRSNSSPSEALGDKSTSQHAEDPTTELVDKTTSEPTERVSALSPRSTNALVDTSTTGVDDQSTTPVIDKSTTPVADLSVRSVPEAGRRVAHDDPPQGSGYNVSQSRTHMATSTPVEQSTSAPPVAQRGEAAPGAQRAPATTYAKVATSLTPDLRRWLKATPPSLGVDGLSSSDIVRLALRRLRAEVEDGLPLADLLIEQAHEEAEYFTGRRNRGMPTRE